MNLKYDHSYDDIINMQHHVSKKHPPMSLYARSAQFAPFAALTGYEDAVKETARQTSEKIDIDEEIYDLIIKYNYDDQKIKAELDQMIKDLQKGDEYGWHEISKSKINF